MTKTIYCGLLGLSAGIAAHAADRRPNILFVVTDDHSQPHVGVNGCPNCQQFNITPNMDAFAADALRMNKGYVTSSHSAPSRVAFFTGMNPIAARGSRFGQTPLPEIPFFTKMLQEAGYWVGITGRSYGPSTRDYDVKYHDLIEKGNTRNGNLLKVDETFNSILETVPEDKPFFLYYGITQPHTPWPKEYPDVDPAKLVLPSDWEDTPEQRKSYAQYLQGLKEGDSAFGQLIQTLKDRGQYENTLIVLMGDNGDSLPYRKCTGYNYGFNVAFMIKHPHANRAGEETFDLVSALDLAPTFLEYAGTEIPDYMEGHSLIPLLEGERYEKHKYLHFQRSWHPGGVIGPGPFRLVRSITNGRYWYMYFPMSYREKLDNPDNYSPLFGLYDLKNDPDSKVNLAGQKRYRRIEAELRKELERWMITASDFMPLPTYYIPQGN